MKNKSKTEVNRYARYATALVENLFGSKPELVEPLGGGLTNFVFTVKAGKEDLVVRMSDKPSALHDFLKEQWAVNRAKEVGVPVPDILQAGSDIIEVPYMIQRKTAGTEGTLHEQRKDLIEEMGHYAALIHSISTHHFGTSFDWTRNKLSKNDTWKNYLHNELNVQQRLSVLIKNKMLPPASLTKLKALIKKMEAWKGKPCLHHGDLRLKNVMADKTGRITALIDWDNCKSSIGAYWDLSIALHDLTVDEKFTFLKGYGVTMKNFSSMAPFLKALNILNYAPVVERLVQLKHKQKLERYRVRLSGHVDLYAV